MRVAYTLEQCWHRVPGGTAVAAIETARALGRRADVALVGVSALHRSEAPASFRPPIEVRRLALPRPALYESWHRLRRPAVQSATGPVDVIHATTIAIPPKTAPLVVTVNDLAWLRDPSHFTKRGLAFFDRGLRLALSDADLVLCPSDATRADCSSVGFDDARLVTVPFGVRMIAASASDIERVRRAYGIAGPYILWAGTVEPRKNLSRLLEAFRLLDTEMRLVLVGPEGWNEDLDALLRETRERVSVLGFIPARDLAPLYAAAEVFCWPSLVEGFGFPVLEAMAQGTPVVTSRGTSTEELARDAGVLVDPRDAESIAQGIRSVLEDQLLAKELGIAGRTRASEYTWERTAKVTAAAYARVAT